MGRRKILTGLRFGKWVVLEDLPAKYGTTTGGNKKIEGVAKCLCDCGVEKEVLSRSLIRGLSTSCGCTRRESCRDLHILPKGEAAFNRVLDSYKDSAKKRNVVFKLSKEFFKNIINSNCFYCGSVPNNLKKIPNGNGNIFYNGIDRKDNTKGYEEDNVVPCCKKCNYAKRDNTTEDFISWVKSVYNKLCVETTKGDY